MAWRVGPKAFADFRAAVDFLTRDRDAGHAARVDPRHELREGDWLIVLLEFRREVPDEHADDDEHDPEQQTLQRRVHQRASKTPKGERSIARRTDLHRPGERP